MAVGGDDWTSWVEAAGGCCAAGVSGGGCQQQLALSCKYLVGVAPHLSQAPRRAKHLESTFQAPVIKSPITLTVGEGWRLQERAELEYQGNWRAAGCCSPTIDRS